MFTGDWQRASATWAGLLEARQNYQKVMDYDPGSRHAKDAARALKDPEIANAKAAPAAPPLNLQPQ